MRLIRRIWTFATTAKGIPQSTSFKTLACSIRYLGYLWNRVERLRDNEQKDRDIADLEPRKSQFSSQTSKDNERIANLIINIADGTDFKTKDLVIPNSRTKHLVHMIHNTKNRANPALKAKNHVDPDSRAKDLVELIPVTEDHAALRFKDADRAFKVRNVKVSESLKSNTGDLVYVPS